MIDADFISQYTTGLYSVPDNIAPRYDEFRDMFSSGQLKSKEWALSVLPFKLLIDKEVIIAGAWFGTLGFMINRKCPDSRVILLDIDPRCKEFIDKIGYPYKNVSAITGDMYDYNYTEQIVINTSCEHIPDLRKWIEMLPAGTYVLLQSNNSDTVEGHVNCSHSIEEFKEKVGKLSEILYSGQLIMPMYTRYMILGKI